jgi:hypothetical protein
MEDKIMKNYILPFIAALFLVGCASNPELPSSVIVKNKIVMIALPDEFLSVPPPVDKVNFSEATQADVAEWNLKSEERTMKLEDKLIQLKNYFILTYNLMVKMNGKDNVIVVDPLKLETKPEEAVIAKPAPPPPTPAKKATLF